MENVNFFRILIVLEAKNPSWRCLVNWTWWKSRREKTRIEGIHGSWEQLRWNHEMDFWACFLSHVLIDSFVILQCILDFSVKPPLEIKIGLMIWNISVTYKPKFELVRVVIDWEVRRMVQLQIVSFFSGLVEQVNSSTTATGKNLCCKQLEKGHGINP